MKTNDLLKLMSEKIAERISGGTPLGAEEIYTVIEESISSLTDMKTQEIPAFVHIVMIVNGKALRALPCDEGQSLTLLKFKA